MIAYVLGDTELLNVFNVTVHEIVKCFKVQLGNLTVWDVLSGMLFLNLVHKIASKCVNKEACECVKYKPVKMLHVFYAIKLE